MLVAELLEASTAGGLRCANLKQRLIRTLFHHLALGLESVRTLDVDAKLRGVQHLLQQREDHGVRRTCAQAPQSLIGKRWIQGDKAVLANVQRHVIASLV